MHIASKDDLIAKLAEGVKKHCEVHEQEMSLLLERQKIELPPDLFQKSWMRLELRSESSESQVHTLSLAMIEIDTLSQKLSSLNFKAPQISLMLFDLLQSLNLKEFQLYHLKKLQGHPIKPSDAHSDPLSAVERMMYSLCHHLDYRKSFEENTGFLETEFWKHTGKVEYLLLQGKDNVIPMGYYFKVIIAFDCKEAQEKAFDIEYCKLCALLEQARFLSFLLTAMGQENKQNGFPLHESTSHPPINSTRPKTTPLLFVSVIPQKPSTRERLRKKFDARNTSNAASIKTEAVTPSTEASELIPSTQNVQKAETPDQPLVKEILKDLPTEKQEHAKLLKENENLRKRLIKSQAARTTLSVEQKQHQVEIETLKKKNNDQKSEFEMQKKALGTQNEKLKQDLTKSQTDNATLSDQKKQLETQIAKLQHNLTKSQTGNTTLSKQKSQVQSQLTTLQSKVEKERKESAQTLAKQQQQIEELLIKNSTLEKKLVIQMDGTYGMHFINFTTLLESVTQSLGNDVATQLREHVEKSMNNGGTK